MLTVAILFLSFQSALADVVPSQKTELESAMERVEELESRPVPSDFDRNLATRKAQRALQNDKVQAMLIDRGYSPEEARSRLDSMSDHQIHMLATASDDLADGGLLGEIVLILIIVLLVILILKMTGNM